MTDDLTDLHARRALCLACLRMVSEVPPTDPRKAGALEEYNRQLAAIDARIAAIEGAPPATVIGLKSASLSAVVPPAKG